MNYKKLMFGVSFGLLSLICAIGCGNNKPTENNPSENPISENTTVTPTSEEVSSESISSDTHTEVSSEVSSEPVHQHSYGDWVVTEQPTCIKEGSRYMECSICGDKIVMSLAKAEHTPVEDIGYASTCEEEGLTNGSHCSVCGEIINAQIPMKEKGHKWRFDSFVWNANDHHAEAYLVCANDPSHINYIVANVEEIIQPHCENALDTIYHATYTLNGTTYEDYDYKSTVKTGHNYNFMGQCTNEACTSSLAVEKETFDKLDFTSTDTHYYTITVPHAGTYEFKWGANKPTSFNVYKEDGTLVVSDLQVEFTVEDNTKLYIVQVSGGTVYTYLSHVDHDVKNGACSVCGFDSFVELANPFETFNFNYTFKREYFTTTIPHAGTYKLSWGAYGPTYGAVYKEDGTLLASKYGQEFEVGDNEKIYLIVQGAKGSVYSYIAHVDHDINYTGNCSKCDLSSYVFGEQNHTYNVSVDANDTKIYGLDVKGNETYFGLTPTTGSLKVVVYNSDGNVVYTKENVTAADPISTFIASEKEGTLYVHYINNSDSEAKCEVIFVEPTEATLNVSSPAGDSSQVYYYALTAPYEGNYKFFYNGNCSSVEVYALNGTVTKDGSIYNISCQANDRIYIKVKGATGNGGVGIVHVHESFVTEAGTPETCTEAGLSDKISCSLCGAVIQNHYEIPAHHTYNFKGVCTACDDDISVHKEKSTAWDYVTNESGIVYRNTELIPGTYAAYYNGKSPKSITIYDENENVIEDAFNHSFTVTENTKIYIVLEVEGQTNFYYIYHRTHDYDYKGNCSLCGDATMVMNANYGGSFGLYENEEVVIEARSSISAGILSLYAAKFDYDIVVYDSFGEKLLSQSISANNSAEFFVYSPKGGTRFYIHITPKTFNFTGTGNLTMYLWTLNVGTLDANVTTAITDSLEHYYIFRAPYDGQFVLNVIGEGCYYDVYPDSISLKYNSDDAYYQLKANDYIFIKVYGSEGNEGICFSHRHTTIIQDDGWEATCTEDGCTDYSCCNDCGYVLQKKEVIPALGHNYKPTGECTRCGKDCFTVVGAFSEKMVTNYEEGTLVIYRFYLNYAGSYYFSFVGGEPLSIKVYDINSNLLTETFSEGFDISELGDSITVHIVCGTDGQYVKLNHHHSEYSYDGICDVCDSRPLVVNEENKTYNYSLEYGETTIIRITSTVKKINLSLNGTGIIEIDVYDNNGNLLLNDFGFSGDFNQVFEGSSSGFFYLHITAMEESEVSLIYQEQNN